MFVCTTNPGAPGYRLDRLGLLSMPSPHDQVVDLLHGFRAQLVHVVLDPPPIEVHLFVPTANAHDLSQGAMILRQVLQLVVIQIAAEPRCGQHDDLPVVHAAPTALSVRPLVDILAHQGQQLTPQLVIRIKVLQRPQDRDDLIPTVQVQLHLVDAKSIQTLLGTSASHVASSVKMVAVV